ncbi:hypothetical protein [Actinopolymorpha sp. B9G3]|uniref:hypothetical protein n=1 Tax=Actinopolymorpha sp. B9G3 TaxID=3158970 RepID=UPI0032D98BD8
MSESPRRIELGGKPTLDPCSVLPLTDVIELGHLPMANTLPTSIKRSFYDGVGRGPVEAPSYLSTFTGTYARCAYAIEPGTKTIDVETYQSFNVFDEDVLAEIDRRYMSGPMVGGYATYSREGKYFMLRGEGATVHLYTDTGDGPKLLDRIARNLAALAQDPGGPAVVTYKSPTFPAPVARACDLVDNADIKAHTGKDASPLVEENLAGATGVLVFREVGDPTENNYIHNECVRHEGFAEESDADILVPDAGLRVATMSFLDAKAAHSYLSFIPVGGLDTNVEEVDDLADGAYSYIAAGTGNFELAFQYERFVVKISPTEPWDPQEDPGQVVDSLRPLVAKMTAKLDRL